jgi:hypothetical protein
MFSNQHVPYANGKNSCPVASIVISTLENEAFDCSREAMDLCEKALCKQINREISYEKCSEILTKHAHTNGPAVMVQKILNAFDNHKPVKASESELRQHKKCRMWNAEEDILLLAAIHKFGLGDWKSISNFVGGGRSRSQCSQRWGRALDPRIAKVAWDANEEQRLINLVAEHGEHSWAIVSKKLGTRSDVQCRYRYYQIVKKGNALIKPEPRFYKQPHIVQKQVYRVVTPTPQHVEVQEQYNYPQLYSIDMLFNQNLFNCPIDQLIPPLKPRTKRLSEPSSPIAIPSQFVSVY